MLAISKPAASRPLMYNRNNSGLWGRPCLTPTATATSVHYYYASLTPAFHCTEEGIPPSYKNWCNIIRRALGIK
jgi:hypothetical protein